VPFDRPAIIKTGKPIERTITTAFQSRKNEKLPHDSQTHHDSAVHRNCIGRLDIRRFW
jgi:hypothetical protein